MLLGEDPSPLQAFGVALILGGVLMAAARPASRAVSMGEGELAPVVPGVEPGGGI